MIMAEKGLAVQKTKIGPTMQMVMASVNINGWDWFDSVKVRGWLYSANGCGIWDIGFMKGRELCWN